VKPSYAGVRTFWICSFATRCTFRSRAGKNKD